MSISTLCSEWNLQGIEKTNEDQPIGTVGIIRATGSQTNCLSDGSSGSKRHDQNPRTDAALGIGNASNARTETNTLEHLVEKNGDQQDDETLGGNGDGDTNEDGVEQDTTSRREISRFILRRTWALTSWFSSSYTSLRSTSTRVLASESLR